jgi:Tfp pilus assembly protein PilZ
MEVTVAKDRPDVAALFLHYARLDRRRTTTGLPVREQRTLEELRVRLNRMLTPQIPKEVVDRRASIRVPIHLPCTCRSADGIRDGTILNLSRSGLLVQAAASFALGEQVWVGIRTDPKGAELEIPGVVATVKPPTVGSREAGIGIRVTHDVPDLMDAIDQLYQWAIVWAFAPAGARPTPAPSEQPAAPSVSGAPAGTRKGAGSR